MARSIVPIVLAVLMLLIGVVGYMALKTPAAASGPTQAMPLELDSAQTAGAVAVYEVKPGASHARFLVDEVLRGSPRTVLGETNQVAGQIALNPADPNTTQVGTILINARTLATDDSMRDRAIRTFILSTDEHEYISFTPAALSGLPQTAERGTAYSFQIVGQLSIRGVTREVTFDVTVTPISASELAGTAGATIRYADWNLIVPDVPFVAGVSDEARLELEFVAAAA